MKKQIWVETNELNNYLKDGWTHVFRQDGTLLSRLYGTMKEYYLLEKEEVKDTIMPEEDENEGAFIYHKKLYRLHGTTKALDAFYEILNKENLSLKFRPLEEEIELANSLGLEVRVS